MRERFDWSSREVCLNLLSSSTVFDGPPSPLGKALGGRVQATPRGGRRSADHLGPMSDRDLHAQSDILRMQNVAHSRRMIS